MSQELIGGSYRIIEKIGEGGFSEVFLVVDRLERKFAIKRVNLLRLNDTDRERFLREARILRDTTHEHIIPIHALVQEDNWLYLVMQWAEQGSLMDRIVASQDGLPVADVIEVGIAVCKTLADVHQNGIIHRDVKPANILLVTEAGKDEPVPKLADFGVARDRAAPSLTRTGDAPGTLGYMPPEAIKELEKQADERRDIFGLGATLYEALTKRRPLGNDFAEIIQNLDVPPTSPTLLRSDVPTWLSDVILKALAPKRDARYSSMLDMLADLENSHSPLEGAIPPEEPASPAPQQNGVVTPAAPAEEPTPKPKSRRLAWWFMGGIGVEIVILLAWSFMFGPFSGLRSPTSTPSLTITESPTASPTHTATVTSSPTPTPTPTPTATASSTPTFTWTPSPTSTKPKPTATRTSTPSYTPTDKPDGGPPHH